MTAPANGRPLLSRTVPVIVARPRVPLPKLGVTLVSNIASTIRAVLNRKILFIAARPPGKTSREFASGAQERNRLIDVTFVGFPSSTSFRCLCAQWDARCGKPDSLRLGEGDLHPLECRNSQPRAGLVSSWLGPGMMKKCGSAAESWLLIGDSLAVFAGR